MSVYPDAGTATEVSAHPVARTVRDLFLLVARVGLGVLMIAHAWLEYDFAGRSISGVGQMFAQTGVPLGALAGPANLLLESVGGVAMILGLAVPVVGVLMALNMVGAWVFVHTSPLFSMDHNGPETVIAIGLLSLALAASGSGRFGLDHLVLRRLGRRA
jgi:putative oxidoreductase